MREWCGCGAAIRGRRSDVLAWRHDHRCNVQVVETGSDTEQAEQQPTVIGFTQER